MRSSAAGHGDLVRRRQTIEKKRYTEAQDLVHQAVSNGMRIIVSDPDHLKRTPNRLLNRVRKVVADEGERI